MHASDPLCRFLMLFASAWTAPKTPDGQPDFQGTWTNATITPFERPDELANKAVLSPKRPRKPKNARPRIGWIGLPSPATSATTTRFGSTRAPRFFPRTKLRWWWIRRDGRVPVTPAAEAKRDYNAAHNCRFVRVHERLGPLHHARRARRHVSRRLQQRLSDCADSRLRRDSLRNDSRDAHHSPGWPSACLRRISACGTATRADTGKATRWWWTPPTTTTKAPSAPAPPPIGSRAFRRARLCM